MKEIEDIIKRVENLDGFIRWVYDTYKLLPRDGYYRVMPDTAKLAMIQEWIIEDKNCIVESQYDPNSDSYDWFLRGEDVDNGFDYQEGFETRNEALAKGIEQALSIIEND